MPTLGQIEGNIKNEKFRQFGFGCGEESDWENILEELDRMYESRSFDSTTLCQLVTITRSKLQQH